MEQKRLVVIYIISDIPQFCKKFPTIYTQLLIEIEYIQNNDFGMKLWYLDRQISIWRDIYVKRSTFYMYLILLTVYQWKTIIGMMLLKQF